MRAAAGAARAVVTLACAFLLAAGCSGDTSSGVEGDTSTLTGARQRVELSPRHRPVVVPTGAGVFVWGGARRFAPDERPDLGEYADVFLGDGALLTEAGRAGAAVAPAPFEAPLRDADGVAVGGQVVVVGTTCARVADVDADQYDCRPEAELAGAVYDPAADTWRELEIPEELRGPATWIWFVDATDDGRAIVRTSHDGAPSMWVIDVESGSWRRVEALPQGAVRDCVVGDVLVQVASPVRLHLVDLDADPDDAGRFGSELPGDPSLDTEAAPMVCADGAVHLFVDGVRPSEWRPNADGTGHTLVTVPDEPSVIWRYDVASDTWSRSASAPPSDAALLTSGTWTGDDVLLFDVLPEGPGLAYDPDEDRWHALDPPGVDLPDQPPWSDAGIPVWTGTELVLVPAGS